MSVSLLVLQVVLLAVAGYVLYWIVRKAVAAGIRDARTVDAAAQRVQ